MNETPRLKPRRYHDLDALRGALMTWGILVHVSTLGPSPWFHAAAQISGLVRMEAFFVISGLLTALLLEKYGTAATLRKRLLSLGVPLVVGLAVLNPIANYLAYCYHNGDIPPAAYFQGRTVAAPHGPMVWHLQLWFLISLLCYALLSPLLLRGWAIGVRRWRALAAAVSPAGLFAGICAVVSAGCLFSRIVFELMAEPYAPRPTLFLIRSTLYYLPFFALGLALFRSPRLLGAFARVRPWHLLAAVTATVGSHAGFALFPKRAAETLVLLSETYLALALAAALFHVARRFFSTESKWASYFADAAYSIYLLHFAVIYILAAVLVPVIGRGQVTMLTIALLTFGITLALHHFAIRRVPLLRLAFNGRLTPSRRRTEPVAVSSGAQPASPPAA